jgi:hypothetical protein
MNILIVCGEQRIGSSVDEFLALSDRRIAAWGGFKANLILLVCCISLGIGVAPPARAPLP